MHGWVDVLLFVFVVIFRSTPSNFLANIGIIQITLNKACIDITTKHVCSCKRVINYTSKVLPTEYQDIWTALSLERDKRPRVVRCPIIVYNIRFGGAFDITAITDTALMVIKSSIYIRTSGNRRNV